MGTAPAPTVVSKGYILPLLRSLRLSLSLVITTLAIGLLSAVAAASPYGGGSYGDCQYSTSCPTAPAPTPTPVDTSTGGSGGTGTGTDTAGGAGTDTTTAPPSGSTSPSSPATTTTPPPTTGTTAPTPAPSGQIPYHQSTTPHSEKPLPHRLTPDNFGGAVYQEIGHAIKMVPAPVAYSFPYLLFLLILALVIRLIWQTQRELRRIAVIAETAKRERELTLEKENFLMLASHYLRTPITIIKGNLELLQSLKTIDEAAAAAVQARISRIQEPAEVILKRLSDNKVLSAMPTLGTARPNPLRALLTPAILLPILLAVSLLVIFQFMLIDFEVIAPNAVDFIIQLVIAALLLQLFISRFRAHKIRQANREDQARLLREQRELDKARSDLINGIATTLNQAIVDLGQELDRLQQQGTDVSKLRTGASQLTNIAEKFRLAAQLEAQAVQLGKLAFPSSDFINQVVADNIELAKQKGVTIEVDMTQERTLHQNQELLHMVVDALVNNAVKFSGENSTVRVVSDDKDPTHLHLEVQDNGPGLSKEQLSTLFKPLSRADSAETFNTEGLGFSLYLAKLITHYLGGDVSIDSKAGQGTLATVMVPAA